MKSFVILLTENEQRQNNVKIMLNSIPDLNIFPAITPAKNHEIVKKESIKTVNTLKKTEISCALSHIMICKKIVENNLPYAIIFEDDVRLFDNFNNKLNKVEECLPENFDFIQVHIPFFLDISKITVNNHLNKYSKTYSTGAYIISYKHALKVSQIKNLNKPIDHLYVSMENKNYFSINEKVLTTLSRHPRKDSKNEREGLSLFKSSVQ